MSRRFETLLQLYKDYNATHEEQIELYGLIQSGAYDHHLGEDIRNTLLDTSPGPFHTADPIKAEILYKIIQASNTPAEPGTTGEAEQSPSTEDPAPRTNGPGLSESGGWLAIAASLMLAATSSLWVFYGGQQHYANEKHYSGKGVFILPDGTRVTLGDDQSALTYFIEDDSRIVNLRGEASFEVEWDRRPFFVQTGKIRTRIIGTTFNVRAYTVLTDVPLNPITPGPSIPNNNNPQSIL